MGTGEARENRGREAARKNTKYSGVTGLGMGNGADSPGDGTEPPGLQVPGFPRAGIAVCAGLAAAAARAAH